MLKWKHKNIGTSNTRWKIINAKSILYFKMKVFAVSVEGQEILRHGGMRRE